MLTIECLLIDRACGFGGAPLLMEAKESFAVSDRYIEAQAANPLSARRFRPRMKMTWRFDVHREAFGADLERRPVAE